MIKKASSFCNQRQAYSVHYSNENGEQRSVHRLCDKSGMRDKARKRNSFQARKVIE